MEVAINNKVVGFVPSHAEGSETKQGISTTSGPTFGFRKLLLQPPDNRACNTMPYTWAAMDGKCRVVSLLHAYHWHGILFNMSY